MEITHSVVVFESIVNSAEAMNFLGRFEQRLALRMQRSSQ